MTQQQQPQWYQAPPAPRVSNGLGTAALVLGIIGVIVGLIPILFVITFPLAVLAIVFGFIGRSRAKRGQASNKGMATAGAVLGIAAFVLGIVGVVIVNDAFEDLGDDTEASVSTDDVFSGTAENPAVDDVTIESCPAPDAFDSVTVDLTVLNHSSKDSSYWITVELLNAADGVTRVGEATAFIDSLAPGQTATVEALGVATTGTEQILCEILEVDRLAS